MSKKNLYYSVIRYKEDQIFFFCTYIDMKNMHHNEKIEKKILEITDFQNPFYIHEDDEPYLSHMFRNVFFQKVKAPKCPPSVLFLSYHFFKDKINLLVLFSFFLLSIGCFFSTGSSTYSAFFFLFSGLFFVFFRTQNMKKEILRFCIARDLHFFESTRNQQLSIYNMIV